MIGFTILLAAGQAAYSTKRAKSAAYASSIAYEDIAKIRSWSCSNCVHLPLTEVTATMDTSYDIQVFVGYSATSNAVVVSFRGSADTKNWIQNLKFDLTNYPGCQNCQVHRGFYQSWINSKTFVLNAVKAILGRHTTATVQITGHSLGGALATLCALDLISSVKVADVYTFGQPRVGNSVLAAYTQKTLPNKYRIVHNADLVPHVPPSPLYTHEMTEIWYNAGMNSYKVCTNGGEDPSCADSVPLSQRNTADHSMDTYLTLPQVALYQQSD